MQATLRIALLIWLSFVGIAAAQSKPVVVELFTSQGCSSCPPADKILTKLAGRDDVIALALHVDYWDYIGWKDSFADPSYTKRQKAYAYAAGRRSVFTPQFIVGGRDSVVGPKAMDLSDQIRAHAAQPYPVELKVTRKGRFAVVSASAPSRLPAAEMVLQLVRYRPRETVSIQRGENAGRTLGYSNVVTALSEVTRWRGRAPLSVRVELPDNRPAVFLLQTAKAGPIIGAAALR